MHSGARLTASKIALRGPTIADRFPPMKTNIHQLSLAVILLVSSFLASNGLSAGDGAATLPAFYDESADGSKQIADALAQAGKDGKRVLLQFGANWCPWCHKLHALFDSDKEIAALLKRDYLVVLIDVNKGHNGETDAKYGKPTKLGLPVIVVLDSDGKQLTTKDSGDLEEGKQHSPEKVLAFLKKWSLQTKA